jgi:hypothetical protein
MSDLMVKSLSLTGIADAIPQLPRRLYARFRS